MSGRIPQPIREAFARIAKEHGDLALVAACAQVLTDYATVGARTALTKRDGDKTTECTRCRERDLHIKRIQEVTQRVAGAVPQGATNTSNHED